MAGTSKGNFGPVPPGNRSVGNTNGHGPDKDQAALRCLSMLELHRFDDEMHAQSTHMFPCFGSGGGLVLCTQTVFQRV